MDTTQAAAFIARTDVKTAYKQTIATTAGVNPADVVNLVLTAQAARRLSEAPRRLAVVVSASYTINVPSGTAASAVTSAVTSASNTDVATALKSNLNAVGQTQATLTVTGTTAQEAAAPTTGGAISPTSSGGVH